jgi:hypothetical protein
MMGELQQAAISRLLQEIRKMNSNLLKKLLAAAMTGLFLISMGASAVGGSAVGASAVAGRTADTQSKCEARGGKWDPKTKSCSIKP